MNENLADEIRKTIESIKDMKTQASGINNYLSILEGLLRTDIQKKVEEAYQRGFEDGKAVNDKGCEGCKYANVAGTHEPCVRCSNSYGNQWTAKDTYYDIIRNSIHNWVTELNVKLDDIASIMEDMRHD